MLLAFHRKTIWTTQCLIASIIIAGIGLMKGQLLFGLWPPDLKIVAFVRCKWPVQEMRAKCSLKISVVVVKLCFPEFFLVCEKWSICGRDFHGVTILAPFEPLYEFANHRHYPKKSHLATLETFSKEKFHIRNSEHQNQVEETFFSNWKLLFQYTESSNDLVLIF